MFYDAEAFLLTDGLSCSTHALEIAERLLASALEDEPH
jgi:uncharacterized protein (UPF0332 family)